LRYDRLSFGGRQVERFLQRLPFDIIESIEVPRNAMVSMVQGGLGVAIIPWADTHSPLPEGVRALPLERNDLAREIGLVTRRTVVRSPAGEFLVQCFRDAANKKENGGARDEI
jgi:DNA-binding transcriptional LysR family regulator